MKESPEIEMKKYVCPVCEMFLEDAEMLMLHIQYKHPKTYKLNMKNVEQLKKWKNGEINVLEI